MIQGDASWLPAAIATDHRESATSDMIPIIYHPKYNITVFGLERLHPFDGRFGAGWRVGERRHQPGQQRAGVRTRRDAGPAQRYGPQGGRPGDPRAVGR